MTEDMRNRKDQFITRLFKNSIDHNGQTLKVCRETMRANWNTVDDEGMIPFYAEAFEQNDFDKLHDAVFEKEGHEDVIAKALGSWAKFKLKTGMQWKKVEHVNRLAEAEEKTLILTEAPKAKVITVEQPKPDSFSFRSFVLSTAGVGIVALSTLFISKQRPPQRMLESLDAQSPRITVVEAVREEKAVPTNEALFSNPQPPQSGFDPLMLGGVAVAATLGSVLLVGSRRPLMGSDDLGRVALTTMSGVITAGCAVSGSPDLAVVTGSVAVALGSMRTNDGQRVAPTMMQSVTETVAETVMGSVESAKDYFYKSKATVKGFIGTAKGLFNKLRGRQADVVNIAPDSSEAIRNGTNGLGR